jgi:hypothetical protein
VAGRRPEQSARGSERSSGGSEQSSGPSVFEKRVELAPGDHREQKIGPDGASKPAVWREFYALGRLRAAEFYFGRRRFAVAGHFEDKFRHILRGTEVVFDQKESVNLLRRPGNCHAFDG